MGTPVSPTQKKDTTGGLCNDSTCLGAGRGSFQLRDGSGATASSVANPDRVWEPNSHPFGVSGHILNSIETLFSAARINLAHHFKLRIVSWTQRSESQSHVDVSCNSKIISHLTPHAGVVEFNPRSGPAPSGPMRRSLETKPQANFRLTIGLNRHAVADRAAASLNETQSSRFSRGGFFLNSG